MSVRRRIRGRAPTADYWPGFVDALSSLLLALIFLLTIFMLTQFFLSQMVFDKDSALDALQDRIAALNDALALERAEKADLAATISTLQESLAGANAEQARLDSLLDDQAAKAARIDELENALEAEGDLSAKAQSEVARLNQQLSALRRQLASLQNALDAAEERDREKDAQIADLGRRLNVALAQKLQDLARYRSDFFGRLREILGNRGDIEVVGDRFVIQSEIFFASGSADLNPEGRTELANIASVIKQVGSEIPDDIAWVLRVDGHSDRQPISTPEFPSNWHLSAARAIAVVNELVSEGVPPQRLVAAGFGEYQPLSPGDSTSDYRRNRRIEFKLTER